jgi:hypothetical protein
VFELLTATILIVAVVSMVLVIYRYQDVFHPLMILMPMLVFMYVFYPILLERRGYLQAIFREEELSFVQGLNLLCIVCLVAGCLAGGYLSRARLQAAQRQACALSPTEIDRLRFLGLVFAIISVLTWVYNLSNVGGFYAAYSVVKGGGTAESGYLRDFFLLGIPAVALLQFGVRHRGLRRKETIGLLLVTIAILAHGILASRRGPTFNILAALIVTWYMARAVRPRLWAALSVGALGGFLLLFLVTFRGEIYLGTDFFSSGRFERTEITDSIGEMLVKSKYANEFIYGTSTILFAKRANMFYGGKRYFTVAFIRPIPRQIWPNKYEAVGMSSIEVNAGMPLGFVGHHAQLNLLGAAPGFVADLFLEFSWGALLASFVIGWIFGGTWRRAVTSRGAWLAFYVCLLAFSVHLIMQTGSQFLYKMLLTGVPLWLGAKIVLAGVRRPRHDTGEMTLDSGEVR